MKYLLILDELQAIAPKRGNDTTNENTFDRLLSCLLTEMDGIKYKTNHIDMVKEHRNVDDNNNNNIPVIFVLGITRTMDDIDPALLRPGRLDCKIFIDSPNHNNILNMLHHFRRNNNNNNGDGREEEEEDDVLLKAIDEYNSNGGEDDVITRAHVKHIYREMCMKKIRELIQ